MVPLREVHGRRTDEAADEDARRIVVDLVRGADLLDLAALEDHDAVGERHRLHLIVGHVDDGGADGLVETLDLGPHLTAQLGVEVGERLVEEEDLGTAHDGAAHGDALALAAGELARLALQQLPDPQHVGRLGDAGLDLGGGNPAHLQAEGHVVVDGLVRIKRVILEHHGDVALARRQPVHHPLADADLSVADAFQPGQHAQGRRLAAAGRPDQHDEFPVGDFEVDALHDPKRTVILLKLTEAD